MKIEISYPGQDVQIIDAQKHVTNHILYKGYDLPFIRCVSTIKDVTLWSRQMKDKDGNKFWDFNHIEDGHVSNDVPTQKHPSHATVWNGTWKKEFAKTVNDGYLGSDQIYHKE